MSSLFSVNFTGPSGLSARDEPKAKDFGIRLKISVSISAEMFRQKLLFWQKSNFCRRELLNFFYDSFSSFWPCFCRLLRPLLAKITFFWIFRLPFGSFLLSNKIEAFHFGQNPFGLTLLSALPAKTFRFYLIRGFPSALFPARGFMASGVTA